MHGRLGDGNVGGLRAIPTLVAPNPTGVTSLVAGQLGTCAITSAAVWCWGEVLPTGYPYPSALPLQVFGAGAISVDIDDVTSLPLTVVGTASAPTWWIANNLPYSVFAPVTQVTVRRGRVCLLRQDGRIACEPASWPVGNYVDEPGFD